MNEPKLHVAPTMPAKEVVNWVDENNVVIGSVVRGDVRVKNLRHQATFIFVQNNDGKLFVQKRAAIKDYCPGYFDPAPGGVVQFEESYADNARRELAEEMGIEHVFLEHCFTFYFEDDVSRCFCDVWRCLFNGSVEELVLQEEEVDFVELMSIEEIYQRAEDGEKFTPDGLLATRKYEEFVRKYGAPHADVGSECKSQSVACSYNMWSDTYDSQVNKTRDLDAVVLRTELPNALKLVAGACDVPTRCGKIVELGCGTGKNSLLLRQHCKELVALDFSENMLSVARRKVAEAERQVLGRASVDCENNGCTPCRVSFRRQDITAPWKGVERASADLVAANLVLEHIENVDCVFEQASVVLKHGGCMMLSEYHALRSSRGHGARMPEQSNNIGTFVHTRQKFTEIATKFGLECVRAIDYDDIAPGTSKSLPPPRILYMLFRST